MYFRLFNEYVGGLTDPNASNESQGLCPFHEDSQPSFSVNISTGLWYCFACETGGGPEELVMKCDNVTYDEAKRIVAELTGQPALPSAEQLLEWRNNLDSSASVLEYLKRRGIWNEELINKYQIGFDGERITIPIRDKDGSLVNVRRLAVGGTGPKVINWAGHGQVRLWPIEQIEECPDNWPLLLCAGEIDCMSAMLQGYHAVTTTGGETAWRKEFTPLFSGKEVVVVYDGDVTGRTQGRKRAYDLVGTARVVKLAQLPDGEDINSLWQQGIRLDEFIEKAIVVSTSGPRLLTGPELLAEAEEELKKPWLIEGLFRPGWFVVFGGHGKAGKTTLAVHMMYALSQGEPFLDRRTAKSPVIYVSYEMPLEELVRLYQDVAGEDPTKWPVSLIDPPQPLTPDNLRQYINSEQKGVIVIDSATPALALRRDEENQGGEVGHRLRLFQQFARTSGWTVVMIHHLKKTGGGYMDLSGSREWIAAPDLLMTWSLDENGEKEGDMKKGTLEVIGRVPDVEPQILYLGRNKVRIAGSQTDMMVQEIVDVLLVNPGMTVEELTRTVQLPRRELLTLLAENPHRFIRKGNGERGNPFKWYVRATEEDI